MLHLTDGLFGASFQYRTPSNSIGYYRGYFRGEITEEEVLKRINANPHRKFASDLQVYNAERIGT